MIANLIKSWRALPFSVQERIHRTLRPTGIPYFLSYIANYQKEHHLSNFAGNLLQVKEEYLRSTGEKKEHLSNQFHSIMDSLILKNGVKKTTYPMRQNTIVARVLQENSCKVEKENLSVLDLPASGGTASLDSYDQFSKYYAIREYVLGDLNFKIHYDARRGCVYDEEGDLLQVRLKKQFFSIYQPQRLGDRCNRITKGLLLPLTVMSRHLKKRYGEASSNHDEILLLHPDVEKKLRSGIFSIQKMDVFKKIRGNYDIVISFNLLQRNYFPRHLIQLGTENLKRVINEGGLLIMGNTESFAAFKKRNGELSLMAKEGDF